MRLAPFAGLMCPVPFTARMPLTQRLFKYGTTLVMTIPLQWAEAVGLGEGDEVVLTLEGAELRVRPKRRA